MNIFLENVNVHSNTGPNHFGSKLVKYLSRDGFTFNSPIKYDIHLAFIESRTKAEAPLVQRLDGIYFNANFDCEKMNKNILETYKKASGVVFQTEFNKNLIFEWFGEHQNYAIIRNGADMEFIKDAPKWINPATSEYKNIWSCASLWHPFKRLKENIRYFLKHSDKNDCLVIAGNPDFYFQHPRIFYVGNISVPNLTSLYKASKYFLHLAWLDHCPNVVVDARAAGCQIICSSAGGTKEIAGPDATIVEEDEWDFKFIESKMPPKMDFSKIIKNNFDVDINMNNVAKKYKEFFSGVKI